MSWTGVCVVSCKDIPSPLQKRKKGMAAVATSWFKKIFKKESKSSALPEEGVWLSELSDWLNVLWSSGGGQGGLKVVHLKWGGHSKCSSRGGEWLKVLLSNGRGGEPKVLLTTLGGGEGGLNVLLPSRGREEDWMCFCPFEEEECYCCQMVEEEEEEEEDPWCCFPPEEGEDPKCCCQMTEESFLLDSCSANYKAKD